MKRWNGWGNADTDYPVPPPALDYLTKRLGHLDPAPDPQRDLLSAVTESRLPAHPLADMSVEARLTHARGQSMRDWVELRYGRLILSRCGCVP